MTWASSIGDELDLPAPIFVHRRGGIFDKVLELDKIAIQAALDHIGIRSFLWGYSLLGDILSFCVDRENFFEAQQVLVAQGMVVEGANTE